MLMSYRIYAHSPGGPPSTQADIQCLDDHEALQAAGRLITAGGTADVWEGTRYVRRVIASSEKRRGAVSLDALFVDRPAHADRRGV
jgi:hypothetical protein